MKLAGAFPALEDEMCDFGLDGLSSGRSPDRLDAMVWAVTALSFGGEGRAAGEGVMNPSPNDRENESPLAGAFIATGNAGFATAGFTMQDFMAVS